MAQDRQGDQRAVVSRRQRLLARLFGDIVIAYETLQRECDEEDRVFLHHLAHLSVHGFLHLIGYDHETDAEADSMERLEAAVLRRLGLPDPYLGRDLRD